MVCPKGCRCLGQAMPDTILEPPDHPFYLPIGLTVANGDVVMDNAQPFTEPCKAACKLGAIVGLDVAWLAPTGNQVYCTGTWLPSNYAVRAWHRFPPTWKMDPCNSEEVTVSASSSHGNGPTVLMLQPMNGAPPLSIQCSSSLGGAWRFILLAYQSNARCNQLPPHAYLATNRNHGGR